MRHNDAQLGAPEIAYVGTKAAIEAAFATEGQIAHATDTHLFGFYNGSAWVWGTGASTAAAVTTNVSGFDNNLSSADDTVQKALDTINDLAIGSGAVATDSIWAAKGDLAVGTGLHTAAKLTVGSDGKVLVAAAGEATGLKWETVVGGSGLPNRGWFGI